MPDALYDRVGGAYDTTRRADSYLVGRMMAHLRAEAGGQCLDAACGTGNYTLAMAASGLNVCGVDASARMIAAAARKAGSVGRPATALRAERSVPQWVVADITRLPFPDRVFVGATCTLALRYFADLDASLAELGRVVESGPLVLFAATPEQIRRYWLRAYFPETIERTASQAYPLEQIERALEAAGFPHVRTEPYVVRPDLEDLFLYSGKHRPSLYLNPAVRAGMWSFAALSPPNEEAEGCNHLRRDLASGRISALISDADSAEGDYMFIIADR